MKQVDLPLIAISTGLSTALTQLRKSKRSAPPSKSEEEYHLFTAGNIAAGRSKGIKTLSDLKSSAKLRPEAASPRITVKSTGYNLGDGLPRPGLGRARAADILARSIRQKRKERTVKANMIGRLKGA